MGHFSIFHELVEEGGLKEVGLILLEGGMGAGYMDLLPLPKDLYALMIGGGVNFVLMNPRLYQRDMVGTTATTIDAKFINCPHWSYS